MNKRVVMASRPTGWVTEDNFRIETAPVPQPKDGEVLVRNHWLSLDPYMRGRVSAAKSYARSVEIGEVMVGGTVSEVIESRDAAFKPGDIVMGYTGWQEYALAGGKGLRKLDPNAAPISTALGVLGMPGMTAYFGLIEVGRMKAGDSVVVSAASGAAPTTQAFRRAAVRCTMR